jgi:endonuclease/exonuclease/phosphatase family metal-dependent hydrolase
MLKNSVGKKFQIILTGLFLASSISCGRDNSFNPNIDADSINSFASAKSDSNKLTLATYNIRNLFTAKSEKQKVALSKAIHEIKSDIIAFEEVESKTTLKNFAQKYLKDLNYNLYMNDAPGKLKAAVLSRFPVSEIKNIRVPDASGKTKVPVIPEDKVVQLDFKVNNNYIFTIFTTYLKPLSTPGYNVEKRKQDINQIKTFFKDFQTLKANYAIMANLNETPDSKDLETMLDPRSSGLNFHDVVSEDLGKGPDIFTVINPQKRVDYLLVSAGMFNEYITGSVIIHKPGKDGNTWKDTFFQDASEHLPVTAVLDITTDN